MSDKIDYLKSIAEDDLQRFIIDHLEDDPEELLEKCVRYIKECRKNA